MQSHRDRIDDREMPGHVAEQFELALGLDSRPETLGDWVDVTAERLRSAGISFGVEEMCLTERSAHRARIGEETHYFACALDTLLLPFVIEDAAAVEVRTESPVSETVIDVTVTEDEIEVEPDGAVMSFGIAGDTPPPEERDGVLAFGTANFCPYINAFVDEVEYERWVDETPEAVTMALPLADGFALAGALSARLPTD